jgi:predicted Zn-dependent protease
MSDVLYSWWHLNKTLRVVLDKRQNPWIFTLVIPVWYVYMDKNMKAIPMTSWTDAQRKWCQEFERLTELVFSKQYRIQATHRIDKSRLRVGARRTGALPSVRVFVDVIDLIAKGNRGSKGIYVIIHSEEETGSAHAKVGGKTMQVKPSKLQYTYRDSMGQLKTRQQRPAIHEVGHIIGYNHPVCSGNEQRCYGAPGTEAYKSIMGAGMNVSMRSYQPFADFLNRFEKGFKWQVKPQRST